MSVNSERSEERPERAARRAVPDGLPSQRPSRDTAPDVAVAYVKLQIWQGNLRPGDRVSLSSISHAIGVSPTSLREAIATLAQQGRVVVKNHRGAFIGPFDPNHLYDHYELLGLVYSWAAGRCAARISPGDAERLRTLAREIPGAETIDDLFSLMKQSEHVIYATAGSFSALNAAKTLEGVVPGNIYSYVPAGGVFARGIMPKILTAIAEGDVEEAAALGRELFATHAKLVVRQLVDDGVFAGGER